VFAFVAGGLESQLAAHNDNKTTPQIRDPQDWLSFIFIALLLPPERGASGHRIALKNEYENNFHYLCAQSRARIATASP
jgi:hypothetical protein